MFRELVPLQSLGNWLSLILINVISTVTAVGVEPETQTRMEDARYWRPRKCSFHSSQKMGFSYKLLENKDQTSLIYCLTKESFI